MNWHVYLIGHKEHHLFKYGITQTKDRATQIRQSEYGDDVGFPAKDSELLYISPPLTKETAETIEILFPANQVRSCLKNSGHHGPREIIESSWPTVKNELHEFITEFNFNKLVKYKGYGNTKRCFSMWHFFDYGDATSMCLVCRGVTNIPALDIANTLRAKPDLRHRCTMWGMHHQYEALLSLTGNGFRYRSKAWTYKIPEPFETLMGAIDIIWKKRTGLQYTVVPYAQPEPLSDNENPVTEEEIKALGL